MESTVDASARGGLVKRRNPLYPNKLRFFSRVFSEEVGSLLGDFFCRLNQGRLKRGDNKAISPFAVLASVSGILGIYLVLVWGEGVGLHYLLIGIYKKIFL